MHARTHATAHATAQRSARSGKQQASALRRGEARQGSEEARSGQLILATVAVAIAFTSTVTDDGRKRGGSWEVER